MIKFEHIITAGLIAIALWSFILLGVTWTGLLVSSPKPLAVQVVNTLKPLPTATQVTFLAVGDIMLSRNVAAQIEKHDNPLLPFEQLDTLLRSTDFNFANLESPFSGNNYYPKTGSLVFNAPLNNVQGLVDYNFTVLNLANNHALDQGDAGLLYTRDYLTKNNIQSIGVGKNLAEAWQPAIVEYNTIKIAFFGASYASINDNGKTTNEYVARIEDVEKLTSAITQAKLNADFVVVTMHAGTEYLRTANPSQITFAHAAIDAGADMVIGAHPHWVQEMEMYNGKYIFYSLGNFIFDQMWSQETREGLALKITVKKDPQQNKTLLEDIELIPVLIENYSTPTFMNESETIKKLGEWDLERFY